MKEGWETKELCDCLSYIKNGANIKQAKGASGIPITRIETLSGGEFHRDRLGYADIFDPEKFEAYILDDADILMSHINSKAFIGRSVIYHKQGNEQIIHGMNLLRLKFYTNLIYPEFANYYFKCAYFRNEVAKIRKDAVNQSSMAISDLKKISIPTPPISEQQHIVEELDLLSSIIEKKKAQLNELDNLAQSLFYEMFGDPITNEKGWSYKKLNTLIDENVITYHLDGNHGGDYPRSEEFVDEGVPYIGANSLNNGFVNFSMAKYLPKERAAKLKKGLAINGDVLFAHNATVGPVAYLITNEPLVILSTSLTAYRCNQDKMNPLFLRAYMQSIWFESQYKASMKQTTRNQIPITQQKKFDFILPPISLQNQFAEKIKVIEHQKELIKQSIKEVETLFNSRMDYYFN